ncbi:putative ABC amino acid transporter solute binding protein [Marinomonas sp. MED121]|uniref:substrate-binding periplasmic protein n=1 Tax=Marinomonas sp. MED121 TaxID=314277 RepID=UPI000068FA32|nr:ABC transporter substrate-binding protein [Marinomonas sp. MED121]EAQ64197.1 putative ABC amino acid transporter solute binding protein [Marinomonas sp. MED121]
MKHSIFVTIFTLSSTSFSFAETTKIRLISSQFEPLQYQGEKPKGYVVDLFNKLRPILKSKHKIELSQVEFFPWKRAVQIASYEKNALFFSLSRTDKRENKFKWLAQVSPYEQAIFSLSDSLGNNKNNALQNWQDLIKANKVLAVQSGSNLENHVFNELLFPKKLVSSVPHYLISIKMLFAGRVDYIPLTAFLAEGTLCRNGYRNNALTYNFSVEKFASPLWAAFNPDTDDSIVTKVRTELNSLSNSTWYNQHQKNTIQKWNQLQCYQLTGQPG